MLYKHSQCNLNKAPTTNAMLPELVYAYKFRFVDVKIRRITRFSPFVEYPSKRKLQNFSLCLLHRHLDDGEIFDGVHAFLRDLLAAEATEVLI